MDASHPFWISREFCFYKFIHSHNFLGQYAYVPCHVFKMSTHGPSNGVDLVRTMFS